MLKKKYRLARADFLQVKKKGRSQSSPSFSLLSLLSPFSHNRYAIVVSTKLHKSAVVRNRLRRAIYSAVADLPGHSDIILFPRVSMLKLSHEELRSQLHSFLSTLA